MFLPLHDNNALVHVERHYVTLTLIALNVFVVVVFQSGLVINALEASAFAFGMIPVEFFNSAPPRAPLGLPEEATLVTFAFLHGGWMHLIGNMAFLWVFGDNVEDAMGHKRYLIFYLACAAFAAFIHGLMAPLSTSPLIGAPGAVAGIVAAYLMLHPHVRVWVLALGRIPLRLPAFVVLGLWVLIQVWNVLTDQGGQVAWWAHLGGLAAGTILVLVLRRPGVPLFDRGILRD